MKIVRWAGLILVGIALVILRGPALVAGLVTDVSGLGLQRELACVEAAQALGCVSQPGFEVDTTGQAGLKGWQALLMQMVKWVPEADGAQRRLAEVDFALGDRAGAAKMLPPLEFEAPDFSIGSIAAAYPTRLMMPGLYDYYLVLAHQQANAGQWPEAVLSYRWALALGAEHFTETDMRDYFGAVAQDYEARAKANGMNARDVYLAGKYLAKSGDWDRADMWLLRAVQRPDWATLLKEEQAGNWTAIGLERTQDGDVAGAQTAYETALTLAPKDLEAPLRLLALWKQVGQTEQARQLAQQLAQNGPTYTFNQSVALTNGWTLVGYNLDEEALATGGSLDVWLWWLPPQGVPDGGLPTTGEWMQVGGYAVEKQAVVNLAPNAGFEWGTSTSEVPLGYLNVYYTDKGRTVETVNVGTGTALEMKAGGQAGTVGVKSRYFAVDSQGLYLMAAWISPKGGQSASVGRECFAANDVDYSVARSRMGNPPSAPNVTMLTVNAADTTPTYVGGVDVPLPGQNVTQCSLYLEEKIGTATFDQILLARLVTP